MNRLEMHIGLECTISYEANTKGYAINAEMIFRDERIHGLHSFTFEVGNGLGIAEMTFDSKKPPPDSLVRYLVSQRVRVLTYKSSVGSYLNHKKGDLTYVIPLLGISTPLGGPDCVRPPVDVDSLGLKPTYKSIPIEDCAPCRQAFGIKKKPTSDGVNYDPIEG